MTSAIAISFEDGVLWEIGRVLASSRAAELEGVRAEDFPALHRVAEWAKNYLLAGHPDLGRLGPVCPWCPPSMERELFWIGCVRFDPAEPRQLEARLLQLRDRWLELEPTEGRDRQLKTMVLVLPELSGDPAVSLVDIHQRMKPHFLARGLMLGEFFPSNDKQSLRNEKFRPLQSPLPLLVIRDMVAMDIAFLSDRVEYAKTYFDKFGVQAWENIRTILHTPARRPSDARIAALLSVLRHFQPPPAVEVGVSSLDRAQLAEHLQKILDQDRELRPLTAVVLLRIDNLSSVAHEFGELAAEQLLLEINRVLRATVRAGDVVGRHGEDFLVFCGVSEASALRTLTERLRAALSGTAVNLAGHNLTPVAHLGISVEAVADPYEDPWTWDHSHHSTAASLIEGAFADAAARSEQPSGSLSPPSRR